MPDYKSMYYHLAGRMATSIEVLDATVEVLHGATTALGNTANVLAALADKLKQAQQATEDAVINSEDDESDA